MRESPHQLLDLVEQDESLALLHAAGGTEHRLLAHDGGVEVGVDDDLARGRQTVLSRDRCLALAEQIQRGLGAGEVPEGLGAAYVQGLGRPECLLQRGAMSQGAVEVEGVGDVEVGLEVQGAGVVDVVLVDGDVARVDGQVAVLRISGRVRGGEVVAA